MHRFMTESDAIKREWLVTWKVGVEDEIAYTLFYIVGDREPYESALSAVETMESYDITPVRDQAFYAFVRGRETEQSRQFYAAFEQPTLMVVPPVAYRPHGVVLFDVVGEPATLEQVRDALPDGITVNVQKIGEYDASLEHSPSASLHVSAKHSPQDGKSVTTTSREMGASRTSPRSSVVLRVPHRIISERRRHGLLNAYSDDS